MKLPEHKRISYDKTGEIRIPARSEAFDAPENFVILKLGDIDVNLLARYKTPPVTNLPRPRAGDLSTMRVKPSKETGTLQAAEPDRVLEILTEDLADYKIELPSGVTPMRPILVKRIDSRGRDYYLIPYQDNKGLTQFIARADAYSGELVDTLQIESQQLLLPRKSSGFLANALNVLGQLANQFGLNIAQALTINREMQRVAVAKTGERQLVWRPCPQSESAFFPFYQIAEGNQTFFVITHGQSKKSDIISM